MEHQHRFWHMGDGLECACGAKRADTRTPEQVAQDRERATEAFKRRYNEAWDKAHR